MGFSSRCLYSLTSEQKGHNHPKLFAKSNRAGYVTDHLCSFARVTLARCFTGDSNAPASRFTELTQGSGGKENEKVEMPLRGRGSNSREYSDGGKEAAALLPTNV